MSGLSIGGIVQVNIDVRRVLSDAGVGCNKGLIVGSSAVIDPAERVKKFLNLKEMVAAGFTDTMPEYLAAKLYFGQRPTPRVLYVGLHDADADPAETVLDAVKAIREVEHEHYGVYVCDASDADIDLIAQEVEQGGHGMLFFDTNNPDALVASPAAPDIFTSLGNKDLTRAIGIYSSKTTYAGAALLGVAMGRETGEENSAFTLTYAPLLGVEPETINETQLTTLMAKSGNVYAVRGQNYHLLHMGRGIDGVPYDDTMYLDMTQRVIESRVMEVITNNGSKIPQSDAGMSVILAAVSDALEYMREIGYIAEGIWNGEEIGELRPGDAIAGGYMVFADSFAMQSQEEREQRKAPPVWVALKTSGTIESVVINVNVNL